LAVSFLSASEGLRIPEGVIMDQYNGPGQVIQGNFEDDFGISNGSTGSSRAYLFFSCFAFRL
jgi:hypothetical protein